MKCVRPNVLTFSNSRESSEVLRVSYRNWGEPYDEGVRLELEEGRETVEVSPTLSETKALAKHLQYLIDLMS